MAFLALGAFVLAERGSFLGAGVATGLAWLTRPLGVALLPALALIAWRLWPERRIPAAQFFQGPFTTALEADEILTEIRVPIRPGAGSAYETVERRATPERRASIGFRGW